jgi:hypothetical protein
MNINTNTKALCNYITYSISPIKISNFIVCSMYRLKEKALLLPRNLYLIGVTVTF